MFPGINCGRELQPGHNSEVAIGKKQFALTEPGRFRKRHVDIADDFAWRLIPEDESSSRLAKILAGSMGIWRNDTQRNDFVNHRKKKRSLCLRSESPDRLWRCLPGEKSGVISCPIGRFHDADSLLFQLTRVSQLLALPFEKQGGLLIHGALAALAGQGVILAGHSGSGKTTVSNRLPAPWRSLCDDVTLIERKRDGEYWAHPWPTWSRIARRDRSGAADVCKAVRLHAVFVLNKGNPDNVTPIVYHDAIPQLLEFNREASAVLTMGMEPHAQRPLRIHRFGNICMLARQIPVFALQHSLEGRFWKNIEKILPPG